MNILLVNNLYPPDVVGGAERSVAFLAKALARGGDMVTVATLTDLPTARNSQVEGVSVYRFPLENRYWPFDAKPGTWERLRWHVRDTYNRSMSRHVERLLNDVQPDLIHTNNLSGFSVSTWDAAAEREVPIVHTLRDYYLLCPRTSRFRRGRICESTCLDCAILSGPRRDRTNLVTTVVGNSRYILDKHLSRGLFSNARFQSVVYNAYSPPNLPPLKPRQATDVVTFGYLGRLAPTKGVEAVMEGLSGLPSSGWRLLLAGTGEGTYLEKLHAMAEPFGSRVQFLGFQDPSEFLRRIDVLIVPSLWEEPLPRTVYESYAHGTPVLASNRGGTPEIVTDGETGFLFHPDEPSALATLMRRTLESPQDLNRMREACLRKAEIFMPENTLTAYRDLYRATIVHARTTT